MFDVLKFVIVAVLLFLAYSFLQGLGQGNVSWYGVLGGGDALQVTDEALWGTPSPQLGLVHIDSQSTPTATEASKEYIRIIAERTNTAPINLTGWSIRSLVSDTRMYLPPATLLLKMTEANKTKPVNLAPGEYALLHSGLSPIASTATSFHTNSCIGYVSKFYNFTPEIISSCNDPNTILPPTPQNITAYGADCVEFFKKATSCTSYTTQMPAHLLPACRDLVARKLTYHSCLKESLEQSGYDIFNNGGWYLYLGHTAEIWRNNYEAIQLLDQDGMVVDVLRY